jgi:pyruvate,orthophosphate dikinase
MSKYDRHIHTIGLPAAADACQAEDVGVKACNLSRMARVGLPVPPAFVLGTAICRDYLKQPEPIRRVLPALLADPMKRLELTCGASFGGARKPLLVSVRSGAAVSMPGMMDTVLNIGLCDATVRGLLRLTGNPRLVWDSYRRLVQQFAEVVCGVDPAPFRSRMAAALERSQVARSQELDFKSLLRVTDEYLGMFSDLTGAAFPQDPQEQLQRAVLAVLDSWHSPRAQEYRRINTIPDTIGTAVTVQRMVFGNAGGTSGSGVAFTRDPATGENRLYLDFLFNSQGEDVVSGRHLANDAQRLASVLPEVERQLQQVSATLETEFRDTQEFEFTVQDAKLYLLQTRAAKLTSWAKLRIAVEHVGEGLISPAEGLSRLAGVALERLGQRRFLATDGAQPLCQAQSASAGFASGAIVLDAEHARQLADAVNPHILVREDISTADLPSIASAVGILTVHGSRTAHAAVVARQLGKVCLVACPGLRIDSAARRISLAGRSLNEGQIISLDANTGWVYEGEPRTVIERPLDYLAEVEKWRHLAPEPAVA